MPAGPSATFARCARFTQPQPVSPRSSPLIAPRKTAGAGAAPFNDACCEDCRLPGVAATILRASAPLAAPDKAIRGLWPGASGRRRYLSPVRAVPNTKLQERFCRRAETSVIRPVRPVPYPQRGSRLRRTSVLMRYSAAAGRRWTTPLPGARRCLSLERSSDAWHLAAPLCAAGASAGRG